MATCARCQQPLTAPKQCSKCKTTTYCGRECQKAHWKSHKANCRASVSQQDEASSARIPHTKPFTAISETTFLHGLPKELTFRVLIDCLRLRQADVYNLDRVKLEGSIYAGRATSEAAFRAFLAKAQNVAGFLPTWWNNDAAEECVQYGLRDGQDFSLVRKSEKADVQKRWNDDMMPMKLRMLGEQVYGTGPGGSNGTSMLQMQVAQEQGRLGEDMHVSNLDVSPFMQRR